MDLTKINKSHQYLLPTITQTTIIKHIKDIIRKKGGIIGVGIWDANKEYEPNSIYLLIHVKRLAVGEFKHIQQKIQEDELYINDYVYGDHLHDFLHMFVIRCPYPDAYQNFLISKYSKMFSKEEAQRIYPHQTRETLKYINTARKAILKDPELRKKLQEDIKVIIKEEYELDSRLEWDQEIFNYVEGCEKIFL